MSDARMMEQVRSGAGFIAALDQSGGSTPKALGLYGVPEDAYGSEAEMFDMIHAMRTRIASAPAFTGTSIIGAILFEMTMDRDMGGKPSARYLWEDRGVVPFLKIDKGLSETVDGTKCMKPIDDLAVKLDKAKANGVFGTKMRSVIGAANPAGIKANVAQQFEIGAEVAAAGLVPIIEPEVTISIRDKAQAEDILLAEIMDQLNALGDETVMLKLTLPSVAGLYAPAIAHPKVARVVALSGGYNRAEANSLLAQNTGMIASFSRALAEGLRADQSEAEFNATLDESIASIRAASVA